MPPLVLVDIISGMKKLEELNPGGIRNQGAYFRRCCEQTWVPTSKQLQEKEKVIQRRELQQKRQEKEAQEREAKHRAIEAEQNDPEAQARIKAMQMAFLNG